jgi:O-antigen ligase
MEKTANGSWTVRIALVAWFVLLNLQTLTVKGWSLAVDLDTNREPAVKIYHLAGLILLVCFVGLRWRLPRPPALVSMLFASFTVLSLLAFTGNTMNPLLVNYIFAFVAFLLGLEFSRALPDGTPLTCLRIASVLVIAGFLVKTWIFRNLLIAFLVLPSNGHPMVPLYFYGGGPNLEATFIALLAALFLGSRWFPLMWTLAASAAVVYSSRTAFLVCAVCALIALVRARRFHVAVLGLTALAIAVIGATIIWPDMYVLTRFTTIGMDQGSQGRQHIWAGVGDAFLRSPLIGYGAGNGIAAVETELNTKFRESNVHNYYAQVLLDFGLPVCFAYCLLVLTICTNEIRGRFPREYGAYLVLFFMAGFLQFRGAESLCWFVLGLYAYRTPVCPKWMELSYAYPNRGAHPCIQ